MKKVVLCAALLAAGGVALGAQTYVDVTGDVGLVLDHTLADICVPPISVGSAWGDYNDDGRVDLFAPNHGGPNRLYRNDGDVEGFDGLPDFTDVAVALGIDAPTEVSISAVFVDYDNDGDQDIYVTNWGGNTLWQNQLTETGTATFVDETADAGLADYGRAITTAWGDFDQDGHLDVYLAKHRKCGNDFDNRDSLYHNDGDGTFTDVTHWLCDGCDALEFGLGFAPGWVDYDNDRDFDLYVVNDAILEENHHNVLWRNDGPAEDGVGWTFTDVSAASGTDIRLNGMGLGVGDVDNDGYYDFAFSNVGENYLLHNQQDGTFDDISAAAGIQRFTLPGGGVSITWGTVFFDHDNDQLQDLYIVAGNIADLEDPVQNNAFFHNNGDLTFTDISAASGLDHPGRARSASIVDFDADGWMDVFVGNYGEPPVLYHNETPALGLGANHWLRVTVEGTVDNRDGIGTRIKARTPGGLQQIRDITSGPTHGGGDQRVAHFGLGSHDTAQVVVLWPNGAHQVLGVFDADQVIHIKQELILEEPEPGLAGETNVFVLSGSAPGERVRLASSPALGTRTIPGCGGATLGLERPATRVTRRTNTFGRVQLRVDVADDLAGQTLYFQAWEPTSCRTSNIVEVDFPDV